MTSHTNDNWLCKPLIMDEFSYFFRCADAILNWHVLVDEDKWIATLAIFSKIVFHNIDSFLSIFSLITNRVWVNDTCDSLHDDFCSLDIEYFVIDDEDSFFVVVEVHFLLFVLQFFIILWVFINSLWLAGICRSISQWLLIVFKCSIRRISINVFNIPYDFVIFLLWGPFEYQVFIVGDTLIWKDFVIIYLCSQIQGKRECWSFTINRVHFNLAIKLLNDLFWNHKAQSDSFWVRITSIFQATKQFEKLWLVFLLDSSTVVFDWDCQYVILFILMAFSNFNFDIYSASLGKFKCIWLEV